MTMTMAHEWNVYLVSSYYFHGPSAWALRRPGCVGHQTQLLLVVGLDWGSVLLLCVGLFLRLVHLRWRVLLHWTKPRAQTMMTRNCFFHFSFQRPGIVHLEGILWLCFSGKSDPWIVKSQHRRSWPSRKSLVSCRFSSGLRLQSGMNLNPRPKVQSPLPNFLNDPSFSASFHRAGFPFHVSEARPA